MNPQWCYRFTTSLKIFTENQPMTGLYITFKTYIYDTLTLKELLRIWDSCPCRPNNAFNVPLFCYCIFAPFTECNFIILLQFFGLSHLEVLFAVQLKKKTTFKLKLLVQSYPKQTLNRIIVVVMDSGTNCGFNTKV
uniref:Uncharacterized protein n=1 Tax=Glossina brevipalpis TaxID=37001 RepID=A0A1A9X0V1_9MUSC